MHPRSWGSQFLSFTFMVLIGCLFLQAAAHMVEDHLSFILLTLGITAVTTFIVQALRSRRQDW